MTTSGSSSGANATAFGRKRLTHARSSSPFATHAGLSRQHSQQRQQLALAAPQVSLFASLATLAAAAAATASPTTATPAPRNVSSSHHHSHSHHQPYHPYHKPSASVHSDNSNSGSSDETEEDERADFKAEFNFRQSQHPQVQHKPQQHRPQFHPQHHHRLITTTRYNHTSVHNMPRRKETKKIQIDVPSSEAAAGIVGDPHQFFKCNGSPIISPRSIRNSLAEPDFDLDGNPRPQKIANTQPTFNGVTSASAVTASNGSSGKGTSNSSQTIAIFGPKAPSQDVSSPTTSTSGNDKKKSSRRRNLRQQQSQQPQEDGEANDDINPQTSEMDLLALKVEEQTLSGMSGVQLWVHRLLYTHHQTLHALGIERGNFPNTKLSLKQLEVMLSPVISLANMMVPDHFGIHVPTPQVAQTMNDVHYWKLWESDTIDIGIFFMPPNSHIPLHNHPGMSVVTRILYGSVNIRSYDLVSPHELGEDSAEAVPAESTDIVGSDPKVKWARVSREGAYVAESTMWLDPRRFNLHQIHAASENGCALLDIMIPPYNNADRDCHHFKIIEERYQKAKNERIVKMIESITADNHNEPSAPKPASPPASKPASPPASKPASPSQSSSI